jgi:hypothetical protein
VQPEFHVRLIIADEACSPEEITRRTGLQPTKTWQRGEQRLKTSLVEKENGWELKSPLPKVAALLQHVDYILSTIEPCRSQLTEFTRNHESVLACAVYFDEQMPELYLDRGVIARLADLNVSVDIDLYDIAEAQ